MRRRYFALPMFKCRPNCLGKIVGRCLFRVVGHTAFGHSLQSRVLRKVSLHLIVELGNTSLYPSGSMSLTRLTADVLVLIWSFDGVLSFA